MPIHSAVSAVSLVVDEGERPFTVGLILQLQAVTEPEWGAPRAEPAPVLGRGEQVVEGVDPAVGVHRGEHGVIGGDCRDLPVEAGRGGNVTPLLLGLETSVHLAVAQGKVHALVEALVVVSHDDFCGKVGAVGGGHLLPSLGSPVRWDDSQGELP